MAQGLEGVREDASFKQENVDPFSDVMNLEQFEKLWSSAGQHGVKIEPEPDDEIVVEKPAQTAQVAEKPVESSEVAKLTATLQKFVESQAAKEKAPAVVEEEEEEFPPPPVRPQAPARYSREEAGSDPNSESAAYERKLEEYNATFMRWTALNSQWTSLKMKEMKTKMKDQERAITERLESAKAEETARKAAIEFAKSKGLTGELAEEFLNEVDSFKITPDSMLEMFMLKKGLVKGGAKPSKQFEQRKQAAGNTGGAGSAPSRELNAVDAIFGEILKSESQKQAF